MASVGNDRRDDEMSSSLVAGDLSGQKRNYDLKFNVLLIGGSDVGKAAILACYTGNTFTRSSHIVMGE